VIEIYFLKKVQKPKVKSIRYGALLCEIRMNLFLYWWIIDNNENSFYEK